MDELTLSEWGILYGIIISTGAMLWHGVNLWHRRRRLHIWGVPAITRAVLEPLPDGYYERWYVAMIIHNRSPRENVAEHWGIEKTKGQGPVVVMQDGLPAKLEGYHRVEIEVDPSVLAEREPRIIYVEDIQGKRYKAKRKHVHEIIEAAKLAVEENRNRSKETPEAVRKAQDQIRQPGGPPACSRPLILQQRLPTSSDRQRRGRRLAIPYHRNDPASEQPRPLGHSRSTWTEARERMVRWRCNSKGAPLGPTGRGCYFNLRPVTGTASRTPAAGRSDRSR